ncbi:hypothetical protein FNH22_09970 [Fulvivirga sp. M361]|uniref:hypothetical protein n=1 Tax=Fulvivirga sp. M361 TaxID=2594266 RepID=UPI00117A56F4|nr:hypothetical protein [Fulvivirga sp. M361]TRX59477.1 hypothetical protein FNH22_09970 [Fulvivirga sp. M361]
MSSSLVTRKGAFQLVKRFSYQRNDLPERCHDLYLFALAIIIRDANDSRFPYAFQFGKANKNEVVMHQVAMNLPAVSGIGDSCCIHLRFSSSRRNATDRE